MLIVILCTFSVGKLTVGKSIGEPCIGDVVSPDAVTKITSISAIFFEDSFTLRTMAPVEGKLISNDGELLEKSTPVVCKSCLLVKSVGRV